MTSFKEGRAGIAPLFFMHKLEVALENLAKEYNSFEVREERSFFALIMEYRKAPQKESPAPVVSTTSL